MWTCHFSILSPRCHHLLHRHHLLTHLVLYLSHYFQPTVSHTKSKGNNIITAYIKANILSTEVFHQCHCIYVLMAKHFLYYKSTRYLHAPLSQPVQNSWLPKWHHMKNLYNNHFVTLSSFNLLQNSTKIWYVTFFSAKIDNISDQQGVLIWLLSFIQDCHKHFLDKVSPSL